MFFSLQVTVGFGGMSHAAISRVKRLGPAVIAGA